MSTPIDALGWFGTGVSGAEAAINSGRAPVAPTGGTFSGIMSGMAGMSAFGPIGQAILGGIAGAEEYRMNKKNDQRQARQRMNESAYTAALQDWYSRRNTQEKRAALSNYNQFSTMDQIMPGYTESYKPAALGDMPNFNDYVAGDNKKTNKKNYKKQSRYGAATVGTGG
jgi:hypothetical protein